MPSVETRNDGGVCTIRLNRPEVLNACDAPKPVIGAVAGPAYGGGLELAVNCDVRVAAASARFACPEPKWAMTITNGSTVLLRRLVGDGWAREMTLLGTVVDAELALRV